MSTNEAATHVCEERLVTEPGLEKAAADLRKKVERLSATLPAKKMVHNPVLFRRFRLKREAKAELASGLFEESEEGIVTSPMMGAIASEACLHIDANYADFDKVLTEIIATLQPYAARVSAAELAAVMVSKRRGGCARGKEKAAQAEAERAAFNIKASGLVELYAAIVGGSGEDESYAMRRTSEIAHRLDCRLREWMSFAQISGRPEGVIEYAVGRNMAFMQAHPHPLATASMAEIVEWIGAGSGTRNKQRRDLWQKRKNCSPMSSWVDSTGLCRTRSCLPLRQPRRHRLHMKRTCRLLWRRSRRWSMRDCSGQTTLRPPSPHSPP